MQYFIVEHPSRGVVMEEYWEAGKKKFRCSYNARRTLGLHYTRITAGIVASQIKGSYVLQVDRTGNKLLIRHLDGRQA